MSGYRRIIPINNHIGMAQLRSRGAANEVDKPRMKRIRANQTQQRARHNEI